ncbi:hypothetical protein PF007_g22383 [Phytophthora fragariae]|uniref:Uncharacterized protein n=1 Tax=Phytophthora fragariae TaxID=53985 RepID=A0A6A3QSR3_9STRA|nr:hypothetical protein PF007_g22383 [Phytophthora fragariae]KAE9185373.1 hypothetical protein PF004_g23379 [Phytophthora fragariae]
MEIKKLVWRDMDSEEEKDELVVALDASISEFVAESAMQVPTLSLPDQLKVRLTVKTGDPLTACRDKIAPIDFLFQVATGYGGLRGTVEEMFARQLPNVWRPDFDLYLKPSNNAPQRDLSAIQEGERDFKVQLETVWHTARLRKNGQADFRLKHALKSKPPRIADFVCEHAIAAGPATQCYMSVQQARLPEEAPIQTPDDATFRQLQWIDQQEEAMEQENTNQASHGEYQTVRVIFEGVPIPLRMNVADLRLALGLPSYSLRPPYRAPSNNAIPDPEVNMDDIDHR